MGVIGVRECIKMNRKKEVRCPNHPVVVKNYSRCVVCFAPVHLPGYFVREDDPVFGGFADMVKYRMEQCKKAENDRDDNLG